LRGRSGRRCTMPTRTSSLTNTTMSTRRFVLQAQRRPDPNRGIPDSSRASLAGTSDLSTGARCQQRSAQHAGLRGIETDVAPGAGITGNSSWRQRRELHGFRKRQLTMILAGSLFWPRASLLDLFCFNSCSVCGPTNSPGLACRSPLEIPAGRNSS
jgi:hypothetical protein